MIRNLSVKNRIILVGVLPPVGDITSMKQVRVLREELAFSDEENESLQITNNPDGSINWNKEGEYDKPIDISPVMDEVIKAKMVELNEQKKLSENHIEIWDMFVEPNVVDADASDLDIQPVK
jgi:hypothetical protein